MLKRLLVLFLFAVLPVCSAESDLLLIQNDDLVLGAKAELGGRVMLLRRKDGENVLHSDPAHWSLKDADIPAANNKSPFVEYQGHIVWVGPYSKWWSDTEGGLTPLDSGFHPDPYLLYDRYDVAEHTATKLVLQGHASPVNGMRMKKTYELTGGGNVRLAVEVTNVRKKPVTWDIWTNTRFHPEGTGGFSVPAKGDFTYEFNSWRPHKERPLLFSMDDKGEVRFCRPEDDQIAKYNITGKLFFHKYCPIIATYKDNVFVKKAVGDTEKPVKCSAGHKAVELYRRFSAARGNLMELEFHSPKFTLQPGESYTFTETWSLKKK